MKLLVIVCVVFINEALCQTTNENDSILAQVANLVCNGVTGPTNGNKRTFGTAVIEKKGPKGKLTFNTIFIGIFLSLKNCFCSNLH